MSSRVTRVAGIIAFITAGVSLTLGYSQYRSLQNQVESQRRDAFCPLYRIFLDSKSDRGRAAAPDPEKYDQAFVKIQKGHDALRCWEFVDMEQKGNGS